MLKYISVLFHIVMHSTLEYHVIFTHDMICIFHIAQINNEHRNITFCKTVNLLGYLSIKIRSIKKIYILAE